MIFLITFSKKFVFIESKCLSEAKGRGWAFNLSSVQPLPKPLSSSAKYAD